MQTTREMTGGLPPEAPSPIAGSLPTGFLLEVPEEMSVARIHEVADLFANAANRQDEYGGSLENNLRMVIEVLGAVRKAVGADLPLRGR